MFFSPVSSALPSAANGDFFACGFALRLLGLEGSEPSAYPLSGKLHEVSGVKVPEPASPFITHETPLGGGTAVAVSRGEWMN